MWLALTLYLAGLFPAAVIAGRALEEKGKPDFGRTKAHLRGYGCVVMWLVVFPLLAYLTVLDRAGRR